MIETLEEFEAGRTKEVVGEQIRKGFEGISEEEAKNVVVAYEPIWSIGTGLVPEKKDIIDTTQFIIETVNKTFNYKPKVLYGGSVNEKNISESNNTN